MIWTHVLICGRWTWRWLTFKQWAVMPHVGKHLAMVKAAKVSGVIVCAGGIGLAVPPILNSTPPWLPADNYERIAPALVSVPEPWSMALLAVGLAGTVAVRR